MILFFVLLLLSPLAFIGALFARNYILATVFAVAGLCTWLPVLGLLKGH